ncbi:MAG: glycosyltransferase family 2 protein, partial [Anaerolineales bacterium]
MKVPRVSVIIPTHNHAAFIGETIESVLNQTCRDFELIIINDGSSDNTKEVVNRYHDPRVRYMAFDENKGEPTARNTGIRASTGEFIAHLDSDDLYHPDKLEAHIEFLDSNLDIGASYNNRFELRYSSSEIRELWRPPRQVGLPDFVLGYPFAPSDIVIRRNWVNEVGLFDESYFHSGEELNMNCRLALAGCRFARVDRALNYRSHHSGRFRRDLEDRLEDVLRALESTFADSRCPSDIEGLRDRAYANHYLVLIYHALAQGKASKGQELVREAARLKADILEGDPSELVRFLVANSIADENVDHEEMLAKVFAQFPPEMAWLSSQLDWAV